LYLKLDPEAEKEIEGTEYQVTSHQRAYKQGQLTDQTRAYEGTTQNESAHTWREKLIGETNVRVHQFTCGIRKHFTK
jgi:hypothetical protein